MEQDFDPIYEALKNSPKSTSLPIPIRRPPKPSSFVDNQREPQNNFEVLKAEALLSCSAPSSKSSILLKPFFYQVGGHGAILKLSDKSILKIMAERERQFYEAVDKWYPQLASFIPHYYGVVDVSYTAQPVASSPNSSSSSVLLQPEISLATNKQVLQILNSTSKALSSRKKSQAHRRSQSCDVKKPVKHKEIAVKPREFVCRSKSDSLLKSLASSSLEDVGSVMRKKSVANPWSVHLYKEEFDNADASQSMETKKYLALEDLTQGLKFPCILDLKMGTRNYGLNATPIKKKSQQMKAQRTTSATLGVRICGMQVYQKSSKSYIFQSKYDGRELTAETFKKTLWQFMNNGNRYLTELIPQLVERLEHMRSVIATLRNFRFYCSSLLVLYDGHWPLEDAENTKSSSRLCRSASLIRDHRSIDVRMIDFAQCVIDLSEESIEEDVGTADSGYLLGLDTLIAAFRELEFNCLTTKV